MMRHIIKNSLTSAWRRATATMFLLAGSTVLIAPAAATAGSPNWTIAATSAPTYFKPGDASDEYILIARNSGAGGVVQPFTVIDTPPLGVTVTGMVGEAGTFNRSLMGCDVATVTCTSNSSLGPGELVRVHVKVAVASSIPEETVTNAAAISGGGAPRVAAVNQTRITTAPVPFGVSLFASEATDLNGNPDQQAGSHPFELTTRLGFNIAPGAGAAPNAAAKDVAVALPPGFLGNPRAVPQCSQAQFLTHEGASACPPDTEVGEILLSFYGGQVDQEEPVFNIAPPPGQPAELGFSYAGFVHIPMFFHVRAEGDYGLTARATNINEANILQGALLTVWGVPASPLHDGERRGSGSCTQGCSSEAVERPFLTLPTSCQSQPQGFVITSDSWQAPGVFTAPLEAPVSGLMGCERLIFNPSITMQPDTAQAAAPAGYTFDLKIPQNEEAESLATPHLKKAVVTLPAGIVTSPSAANGLVGCGESGSEGVNLHSAEPAHCPDAAKVGTVEVEAPALEHPLMGAVYLAQQGNAGPMQGANPFGSLIALYVVVEGSGVVVKLAGEVSLNPLTGQATVTFSDNPQLPFSDLRLKFFGGSGAALVNPASCGTFTTTAQLTPWSGQSPATRASTFEVVGCHSATLSPRFEAGMTSNQAGTYSPFTLTLVRKDSEDDFAKVSATLPPGVLGKLAGVPRCSDAQANTGACPQASQIGSVTVGAGPGPAPVYVHGAVYLTGPYGGAPFGEVVVVPAIAGPFNLGMVAVRGALHIDSRTAQVTAVTDPFPTMLQGIPLQVKSVQVELDRAGFMLNPTSCAEEQTTGTIVGTQGLTAAVASRFQAAGCASLAFKPVFKVSTRGAASKAQGASLHVTLTSRRGQANIATAKVDLPVQLPTRQATLQKACVDSVFKVNPAACPAASAVGTVKAYTPLLSTPLSGPIYLVSHGGKGFPDLVFVLQGEGITLLLDGSTNIKRGITSEAFKSLPDAPVSGFEATFPTGPFSALGVNLPAKAKFSFCGQQLNMPTKITAQNGAVFSQTTRITVTGCAKRGGGGKATTSRHRAGNAVTTRPRK